MQGLVWRLEAVARLEMSVQGLVWRQEAESRLETQRCGWDIRTESATQTQKTKVDGLPPAPSLNIRFKNADCYTEL